MPFFALFKLVPWRNWLWLGVAVALGLYHWNAVHRAYQSGKTDAQAQAEQQRTEQSAQIVKAAIPANTAIDNQYDVLSKTFTQFQATYTQMADSIPDCRVFDPEFVRLVNQQHKARSKPL